MSVRQIKILPILLLIFIILIQYRLWFDTGGILALNQLKEQLTKQTLENDQLKQKNEELIIQIQHLQTNQDAIESRARQELGMIKKGETFYHIVK